MEENEYIEEKEASEQEKKTPFQSPLPLILKLRNLIFGKNKPDIYTQFTFFLNLIIWFIFLLWSLISYFAIKSRALIAENKGISIDSIIAKRGSELEFGQGDFLDHLITLHSLAIICWVLVFIGLVLLYRKKKNMIYMTVAPILFYIGMQVFYISYRYFVEDTTTFDKIALLVSLTSITICYFLQRFERQRGGLNFFGELETDDESAEETL